VRGALLVPGEHMFDFRALEEKVQKGEKNGSRVTEDELHALEFEAAVDDFGAREFFASEISGGAGFSGHGQGSSAEAGVPLSANWVDPKENCFEVKI
jgi:hypothetical protein